ncbi:uncharacterized protein LOC143227181 [Tachypleus tridentatus]|uniref:uncharacterized protein LOC143227181 n=1 Tax=Tachypleus tridentatus TaxID=6853 RepID=UPI003FD21D57
MAPGKGFIGIKNFQAIAICTCVGAFIGLCLMIGGAAITGVAYTEVPPPFDDPNYDRYQGSNPRRVIGPIMMVFGALLLFGGCCFIGCAFWSFTNRQDKPPEREMNHRGKF